MNKTIKTVIFIVAIVVIVIIGLLFFVSKKGNTVNNEQKAGNVSSWTCGSPLVDTRDAKNYKTVLIGKQCWMAENINVGIKIAGSENQGTNCSSIQKYCYDDNDNNCKLYGGLYQWNQTMCGSITAGTQGICPIGWHVPSHDEFTTLERAVCISSTCATDFPYDSSNYIGERGTNEGRVLRVGGTSKFNVMFAGSRYPTGEYNSKTASGSFNAINVWGTFWSSSTRPPATWSAWDRTFDSGKSTIYRIDNERGYGVSVRCLKNK
ncbi:MAG: FISUMP domain-containing protein [bacterium]|nr:FISUMP domain-containing protein [bacterium]